jgi:hypothetical protein
VPTYHSYEETLKKNTVKFPIKTTDAKYKSKTWDERTQTMYLLKELFQEQGLIHGVDYYWTDQYDNQNVSVLFANEENTSYFMLLYQCQKNP